MNLHDWIDELCDVLDVDIEFDEGLVLDLARVVAHTVERRAAPVSTYILGYAAAAHEADAEGLEALVAKAQALADGWDQPAGTPAPEETAAEVAVPDDSGVDHTKDRYDA